MNQRRQALLQLAAAAAILVTAALLASVPSCSAAVPASAAPPKKKPFDITSTSSIVFPLQGDVYPRGVFYVTMLIGDPPKPYILDVDTGSDLSWLHCNAPCVRCPKCPHPLYRPAKNRLIICSHPLCPSVPGHRDCDGPEQCDYEIHYADKWSSLGVLVTDAFAVQLTNASIARPHLAFGCGYDQQGPEKTKESPVDGMLGLGSGPASFVSQLQAQGITRGVVGHCLGRKGAGYLFFGDALIPYRRVTWARMQPRRNSEHSYYSPGPASLALQNQNLQVSMPVAFDSGSSYTYFANKPYEAFLSAVKDVETFPLLKITMDVIPSLFLLQVKQRISRSPLKETQDKDLPVCWKGTRPFKSMDDAKNYFSPLILTFANPKGAQFEIPPDNYLIITNQGNACLGILNGTEVGLQDLSVIGDISMQDLMVIYDNEKQLVGWAQANCDRPRNEDENNGFEDRLCRPLTASMDVLPKACPAY